MREPATWKARAGCVVLSGNEQDVDDRELARQSDDSLLTVTCSRCSAVAAFVAKLLKHRSSVTFLTVELRLRRYVTTRVFDGSEQVNPCWARSPFLINAPARDNLPTQFASLGRCIPGPARSKLRRCRQRASRSFCRPPRLHLPPSTSPLSRSTMDDRTSLPNPTPQSASETEPQSLPPSEDLIASIKESADKLAQDASTRGDLKLLSRTLQELRYALKMFKPYRGHRKVTVFGSSRTRPEQPAYEQALCFGRAMAAHQWMVITGAASGIMEAAHRGAGREHAIGLNIMLPYEQQANPIIAGDDKLVHMKYFFTRKLMFVKECHAVVCVPGGFGTLDEALEVLTLLQTGKHDMMPVVLLDAPGGHFWTALHDFICEHLLHGQMISADDLHLYKITDNYQQAVDEIITFYRNFHSMRFVNHRLVLRLNRQLSVHELRTINQQFADILSDGHFRQSGPLKPERDDQDCLDKNRLVFHFNRRSQGRLRMLIDWINQQPLATPDRNSDGLLPAPADLP